MSDNKVIINERPLPPNLDELPFPAWELFEMDHYVLDPTGIHSVGNRRKMTMISGRGCSYHCTFCYRMEKGLRLRSIESIVEEAQKLVRDYDLQYLHFNDELVVASPERAIALSEAFIKAELNVGWGCAGRLNIITPEALKSMKRAGCVFISYGMESMDDEVLRKMNKELTSEIIIKGVQMTDEADIAVGFNFIFGNLGDTPQTLQKSVDFLLRYDKHSQIRTIRPVTPYPGSPLFKLAVQKGLLKDCAEFYEVKHTNSDLLTVNFTDMTDDEFYKALHGANMQLLNNYVSFLKQSYAKTLDKLYLNKDASFRGFRKV